VDTTETTHISLCSGYGGIDLGLRKVISSLRTVAYAEIEAFACENLLARMEGGQLDAAPIWSDLKSFPWTEFSGMVDILSGGYPCQPFSAAGKRLGTDDPRHLWPYIASGIRLLRPKLCFFENVEGHISLGLREVVRELEELGYETAWGIFSAAECGAPHQRKRVFIMAHRNDTGLERYWRHVAEYDSQGRQEADGHAWPCRPGEPQHAWEPPRVVVGRMAHSNSPEPSQGRGDNCEMPQVPAEQRKNYSSFVSGGKSQHRGEEPPRVVGNATSSGQSQWRSGALERPQQEPQLERPDCHCNTECKIEPTLGRDTHGTTSGLDYAELCVTCDNRTDELRLLGNGVVPATAALAFQTLLNGLRTRYPTSESR
jgi:DNA (cytosine-5)-methyltransferase 1